MTSVASDATKLIAAITPQPILDLLEINRGYIHTHGSTAAKAVNVAERLGIAYLGYMALQALAATYSTNAVLATWAFGSLALSTPAGATIAAAQLLFIAASKATAAWTLVSVATGIGAFAAGIFALQYYADDQFFNKHVPLFGSGIVNQLIFGKFSNDSLKIELPEHKTTSAV